MFKGSLNSFISLTNIDIFLFVAHISFTEGRGCVFGSGGAGVHDKNVSQNVFLKGRLGQPEIKCIANVVSHCVGERVGGLFTKIPMSHIIREGEAIFEPISCRILDLFEQRIRKKYL